MIALSKNEKLEQVSEAIQRAGGRTFIAKKTDEGVRIEQS
jgi:L-lactate utilization protein LutB